MWKILRDLREAKGLSRSDVGRMLSVKEVSVWRWEHSRESGGCNPEIDRLPGILELYGADDSIRESIAQELRIIRAHATPTRDGTRKAGQAFPPNVAA